MRAPASTFAPLLFASLVAGCGGLGSHDVELTIGVAPSVPANVVASITALELGASTNGHGTTMTYALGRALAKNERITVHVSNDRGPLAVGVIARDGSNTPVAAGHGSVPLDGTGPHSLPITLEPLQSGGALFTVTPTSWTLFTGQSIQLSATAEVRWSVMEGDAGGTVDADGTYHAPDTAGAYTVVASSTSYFGYTVAIPVQVLASGVVPLAGSLGGPGYADGPLGQGRLVTPFGMVSDGQFIYFASQDKMVRKLEIKTGTLSTLAGALDLPAPIDGTGAAAHFVDPHQVALDSMGNLYVADSYARSIRKIVLATGQVTTFVGNPAVYGDADGTGSAASFMRPTGIAWDGARTLYVADFEACNIRKIDLQTAAVTTLAGTQPGMVSNCGHADGTGAAAVLRQPLALAYDGQGNLWVAEAQQYLRKVVVGTGAVTSLSAPPTGVNDIAWDGSGGLWVSAFGTVGRVDLGSGQVTAVMGPMGGIWNMSAFGITFAPDGTLYVGIDHGIYALDAANKKATLIGGTPEYSNPINYQPTVVGSPAVARFNFVNGIDVGPDGILYTRSNDTWVSVDTATGVSKKEGLTTGFNCCTSVISDGKGSLYVLGYDSTFRVLTVGDGATPFPTAGDPMSVPGFADGTGTAAKFNQPQGIAVDLAHGVAYIADTNNAVIRKVVVATGQTTTFLGTANMVGYVDDVGTAARLAHPRALVYDGAGTLYFGDDGHIRKATVPGGLVSTVAGNGMPGSVDGPAASAEFYAPNGMVLDAAKQNLYITDQLNNNLRKVALATGMVSTVTGQVGHAIDVPGPLSSAMLNQPQQIAVTPKGDLVVATPREQILLQIRLP